MSRFETLFLSGCGLFESDVVARVLGMSVHLNGRGEEVLSRPSASGTGMVGGRPIRNMLAEPGAELEDAAAYDIGYSLMFDISATNRIAQVQEAEEIFNQLVVRLPEMAVLFAPDDAQSLRSAYLPGKGVHCFPEGTTPYAEHKDLWLPWVVAS